MIVTEIFDLTALELGDMIRKREIGAREAAAAFSERSEAFQGGEGGLNAFVTLCPERAALTADDVQKKLDSGLFDGALLAGVPIGVKDNISTKGIRTTCASKMLENYTPPFDATAFENAVNAGLVAIGKLNMDEFAMGCTNETSYFGAVRNPWDLTRAPGGSSGGSAAAVAAGLVPCALGSDTGGSVRQPASWCGVTGFKPTYGTVSRFGLVAYASSLDQIGPIARTAADCAALTDVIRGADKRDATSLSSRTEPYFGEKIDFKSVKIGIPKECFGDGVDDGVKRRVLEAVDIMKKLGADVREISLPFINYCVHVYYIIAAAEASSNLSRFDGVKYGFRAAYDGDLEGLYAATRGQGFGAEVKKRILLGAFALSSGYYDAYYLKAKKTQNLIKHRFDEAFDEVDFIICPTSPQTAQPLNEKSANPLKNYLSDIFTVSANLAGLPALSFPCGLSGCLPVGAQVMGRRFDDARVLALGAAFQRETDFHNLRPKGGACRV